MATGKIEGGTLPVNRGGTGASAAANARANLGIPEPYNSTVLYNGNVTTPVANGTTLTLTDDATNYKYLVILAYSGTPASGTRMAIFDSTQISAGHGVVGASGSGTMGAIYVERSAPRAYLIVSSTFPPLYIQYILGIK
jgi:hypothetical protein